MDKQQIGLNKQRVIEDEIGLTDEEGIFINLHRNNPVVERFCRMLGMQIRCVDRVGLQILRCALDDLRKEIADSKW